MTRLLVSVRDRAEALRALDAGADLIDIKEPRRGSLGGANAATIAAVVQAIAGRVPVSAAFGELIDHIDADDAPFAWPADRLDFAKIGLANCARMPDWAHRWQVFHQSFPESIARVAVVYADDQANTPTADEVVSHAVRFHCKAVLVDTFDKLSGPLICHWAASQIRDSIQEIQSHGMLAVLAGGLTESIIESLLPLAPDFFAVRGAVCADGKRAGMLCSERIRRLKSVIGNPDRATQTVPGPTVSCCGEVFA